MLGIYDLNECNNLNYKTRLKIYKSIGFTEVALYLDDDFNKKNESYENIIYYCKKIGLSVKQVHLDYRNSNLICNSDTDEYFTYVSDRLNKAINFNIPFVVTHASSGDTPPKLSQSQLKKFANMMHSFDNKNVYLCIENVRNNYNLDKLLSLKLKNVAICYDLGHAHCYDNEYSLFEKYKSLIKCSHLHNNYGKDTHQPLNNGEIDCKYFIKKLEKINGISNCLECFPPRDKKLNKSEFIEFIKQLYIYSQKN